ncbi:hypothetical protein [Saccharothrix deserti]|uniref:hypothetical protein n=1 Tax=Saccharothrix deserti TaxID=2593674 RepID=UPI00131E426B|nr:hypothetical protein [Saccharothrix deserti]
MPARWANAHEHLDDAVSLALCRALLSRAHRLSGDHHAADRQLTRALAPVVGTDDTTAQQVRDLAAGTRQFDAGVRDSRTEPG